MDQGSLGLFSSEVMGCRGCWLLYLCPGIGASLERIAERHGLVERPCDSEAGFFRLLVATKRLDIFLWALCCWMLYLDHVVLLCLFHLNWLSITLAAPFLLSEFTRIWNILDFHKWQRLGKYSDRTLLWIKADIAFVQDGDAFEFSAPWSSFWNIVMNSLRTICPFHATQRKI